MTAGNRIFIFHTDFIMFRALVHELSYCFTAISVNKKHALMYTSIECQF